MGSEVQVCHLFWIGFLGFEKLFRRNRISYNQKIIMTQNSSSPKINKSPMNKSVSKACFSFSKSPREENYKPTNDKIYDIPSMLNKRSTSIGFGKKSQISAANNYPSPDKYNSISEFSTNPKKGQTFGVSRCDFKANPMIFNSSYPGPGQYDYKELQTTKNCFAIRGRDGFPKIFNSTHNPGPGQYAIKQDTDKQFFMNSRNKSPKIYTIKKAKDSSNKQNSIGPGKYQTSFASMGRQLVGHKKSQASYSFSKMNRETMPLIKSRLGPGSYNHFSQFGQI